MTDKLSAEAPAPDTRRCTCHPDDAPVPCQHKYALHDCLRSYLTRLTAEVERLTKVKTQYQRLYDKEVTENVRLRAALLRAAIRFELLAAHNDDIRNGVQPSVGGAEARAALQETRT